jgi:hypothetical protein
VIVYTIALVFYKLYPLVVTKLISPVSSPQQESKKKYASFPTKLSTPPEYSATESRQVGADALYFILIARATQYLRNQSLTTSPIHIPSHRFVRAIISPTPTTQ